MEEKADTQETDHSETFHHTNDQDISLVTENEDIVKQNKLDALNFRG
jgi:hypothetical protein